MPAIKLIIADDHEIFRDGLKLLLKKLNTNEVKLIAEAENGKELIQCVEKQQPDVVLIDIQMPVMDGIEACRILNLRFPKLGIIALSTFNEENLVIDMLQAGAKGYLLKNTNKEELLKAIKKVHGGEVCYTAETLVHLAKKIEKEKATQLNEKILKKLTKREIEVMGFLCEGHTNKEVASKLDLSIRTVETYREKIMKKLDAKSAMDIMIFAIKNKIYKI